MNLPTFRYSTRFSATRRRTWRCVTPSLSASSSMVNSFGTTTGPGINLLLGLVFQPVGTKLANYCSPTNAHTSGPPCTSPRAATVLPSHHPPRLPAPPTQGHRSQPPPPATATALKMHATNAPKVSSARSLPLLTPTARTQKSLSTRLSHPDKPQSEENTIASRWLAKKLGRVCCGGVG